MDEADDELQAYFYTLDDAALLTTLLGLIDALESYSQDYLSATTLQSLLNEIAYSLRRRRNLQDRVEVDQADISTSDDPDEILAAIEYSVDSFLTDLDSAATAN